MIDHRAVRSELSDAEKVRYRSAIRYAATRRNVKMLTSAILFEAAEAALADETSATEGHIGILPGTMNPVHYGHLSASLAAVLTNHLNLVLLAGGGIPPDKPYSAEFGFRREMIEIALRNERGLGNWLKMTTIRQQMAEMFSEDSHARLLAGDNDMTRRTMMDLAAFVWLFVANPNVQWTYIVGSDKIASYGKKGEFALIVETLGHRKVESQVLYYLRAGQDIDVNRDIVPFDWLLKKWKSGFFKQSQLPSCELSASEIRLAIVDGRHRHGINLTSCLPIGILEYIRNNNDLLASYARQIEQADSRKG